jgi:hypothetical protein
MQGPPTNALRTVGAPCINIGPSARRSPADDVVKIRTSALQVWPHRPIEAIKCKTVVAILVLAEDGETPTLVPRVGPDPQGQVIAILRDHD